MKAYETNLDEDDKHYILNNPAKQFGSTAYESTKNSNNFKKSSIKMIKTLETGEKSETPFEKYVHNKENKAI